MTAKAAAKRKRKKRIEAIVKKNKEIAEAVDRVDLQSRFALSEEDQFDPSKVVRDESGRYVKGHSANPGGRPAGRLSLTSKLKKILSQQDPKHPDKTNADTVMEVAVLAAKTGEFRFFQEILNRVDGKVADKLDLNEQQIKMFGKEAPVEEV